MTEKEVLKWALDIASDELFRNSGNYLMTIPKPGCERQHADAAERVAVLEKMIEEK